MLCYVMLCYVMLYSVVQMHYFPDLGVAVLLAIAC
jgi:hypothetical protein